MKRILLPQPPNSRDVQFRGNVQLFMDQCSDWMRRVKGAIEDASRINDIPLGQQFLATNFSTNTLVTGTTTGTDLSNFVASLVEAMSAKGLISPTVQRGD